MILKKLNNKGFTLVEVIAVVVILSILTVLLVPNVTGLLNKGEEDAYENLKQSILVASREYITDNRYYIELYEEEDLIIDEVTYSARKIKKISDFEVVDSKIPIAKLLELGYLSSSGVGGEDIVNPNDKEKKLDLNNSYIYVVYLVNTKDYKFYINNNYLIWK